jgi:hypothetical protein
MSNYGSEKKVSEKGTKNRCGEIKDSNGRIIADSKGIKQRWKEYVQELINWSGGIDDIINGRNELLSGDNKDTTTSEVPT